MANYKSSYTGAQIDSGISKANTAVQPAALESKQDTLVSGTNIKTINNLSILGEGNLVIEGGEGSFSYRNIDFADETQWTGTEPTQTVLQDILDNDYQALHIINIENVADAWLWKCMGAGSEDTQIKRYINFDDVDESEGTPAVASFFLISKTEGEQEIDFHSSDVPLNNYSSLDNKPLINSVELNGNKSLSDLGIQSTLVSGTNIKTINNTSLLGEGNITIEGGSSSNSDWMNSRIDFMGDSITEGYPGGSTVTKKYWEFLGDKLNATVHGYGIGGSTIADGSSPMFSRVLNMEKDVDLIFVFGGTNDFANYNRVLGDQFTVSSGTRTLNTNTATFYGGLNQLCLNLITTFPSATYVLLTPIHRKNFSGQKTDLQANGQGLYLDAYVDAIKKVGDWFSIPVIDLYNHSSLYPQDQTQKLTYFASDNDGLHPNTLGHEVLGNVIYDELKIVTKKLAGVTYSITKNVTNGTATGATSIAKNGTASVTITANTGYAIPTSVTVTGASYNYNSTTGVVTLTNPTNDIVITANCVQVVTYSITGNITNGTKTGATSIIEGRTASVTIVPNNGYILPSNITVTNATYTYNNTTGVVNLSEPAGDVTISATCVEVPSYSITTSVTNGSYSGASVIYEGSSAQVVITPNQNYKLPDSVTVVGASQLYSSSTGVVTLSNPTGNVTISATCPAIQTYLITNNITHGVASGPSTITENGTATIEITPDTGYYMPDSVTVTGADYNYDKANASISLSNPTDNVAITVECTNVTPATIWYMDTTSVEACPNLSSYQTVMGTGAFAAGRAATGKTPNPPVGSPINMVRFRAGKGNGTTTGGDGSDVTGTLIVGKFNTSTRKTTEIHEVPLAGLGITSNRNIVSEVEIPLMTIEENEVPLYYTANHATFAPYHVSAKDIQMTTLQFQLSTQVGGDAGAAELTWSGNLCIDWGYKG